MSLRNRNGRWHYRFKVDGREYAETTGLDATKQNKTKALEMEILHRQALREGRRPEHRVTVRQFNDVAKEFLEWTETEYREHPNSHRRLAVSMTSAKEFFQKEPVSLIDAGRIEAYKSWRMREHKIR